jgi:hypothetical protein
MMRSHNEMSILEVLDKLDIFAPVKICFNDSVLYNDYDATVEDENGIIGETAPHMLIVPIRLKTALDKYDIYVNQVDIRIVQHHHSIVYLYGRKALKEHHVEKI